MKKIAFTLTSLAILTLVTTSSFALDPLAPRSFRKFGMLYVKTPNPPDDVISVTNLKTKQKVPLRSDELKVVRVGRYQVKVKMQSYTYKQTVWVDSTERTDVIVPGFGNLKVIAKFSNVSVEVYGMDRGKLVAKFPANEVKTLPRGHYQVKIKIGRHILTEPDVWVVTNTTRILDVFFKS